MKEIIIKQCLEILKRPDVKNEIENITKPIISLIFKRLKPYILICVLFIFSIFSLILGIFFILARKNKSINFFKSKHIV